MTVRVLHLAPALDPRAGGVIRFVVDLCAVLADTPGVEMSVAAPGHVVNATDLWPQRPPRLHSWPARAGARAAWSTLEGLLEATDVLHVHGMWRPSSLWALGRAWVKGSRTLVTPHGMLDPWSLGQKWWKKRPFLACARPLLERCDWHCTSQREAAALRRVLRVEPRVSLPPFVVPPAPERCSRAPGDPLRVLYLSRLHHKKGPDVLIEALGRLRRRGVSFEARFAGEGEPRYLNTLRARVSRQGLPDCLTFVGHVEGDEKARLLAWADVFALPTWQENFGYAVVEALAAGCAVVGTRGLDHWQRFQAAGAVIVPREAAAFGDALAALAHGIGEGQDLSGQGIRWARETFGADQAARLARELYV